MPVKTFHTAVNPNVQRWSDIQFTYVFLDTFFQQAFVPK